jgi:hypothetical protein
LIRWSVVACRSSFGAAAELDVHDGRCLPAMPPLRLTPAVVGPLCLAAYAMALLLPGLGDFGLWQPEEQQIAELAAAAARGAWSTVLTPDTTRALWPALGIALASPAELPARLPPALLLVCRTRSS